MIKPGQIYKYTIQVWPTANLFKAGHRIRLEVSSSNFPAYDRNPNTGHAFAEDSEVGVADQTIFHDRDHPSEITLPIVEAPLRQSVNAVTSNSSLSTRPNFSPTK